MYRAVKEADEDLEELVVRFDLACIRCAEQVNFLQRMRHLFEPSHLELQHRALEVLVRKLKKTEALLSSLVTPKAFKGNITLTPKKLHFGLHKDTLMKAVGAVEVWQKLSDPQWFVTNRLGAGQFDVRSSTQAVPGYHYGSTLSIPSLLQYIEPITDMEITDPATHSFIGCNRSFDGAMLYLFVFKYTLRLRHVQLHSDGEGGRDVVALRHLLNRYEDACSASSRITVSILRLLRSEAMTKIDCVQFWPHLSREQEALSKLYSECEHVWTKDVLEETGEPRIETGEPRIETGSTDVNRETSLPQ